MRPVAANKGNIISKTAKCPNQSPAFSAQMNDFIMPMYFI